MLLVCIVQITLIIPSGNSPICCDRTEPGFQARHVVSKTGINVRMHFTQ